MKTFYKINLSTLLILFLFSTSIYAQKIENSIYGYVFDKSTGEPIEDVNVYLSNTTWGSSTNKEGYFRIRQIPQGIHELVVTNIGYNYESKSILMKSGNELKFEFHLKPIIYETETTLVEESVPTKWLRDLEFFKHYFLGQTEFVEDCEIDNAEVLNFTRPNRSFFIGTAEQPLIITNKALGYQISCVLVSFSYSRDTKLWRWSIKPKFTELKPASDQEYEEWKINRIQAYKGSLYHFLRSFMTEQLKEEGFDIYPVSQAGVKIPRQRWRATIVDYEDFIEPGILSNERKLRFNNYLHVVYENNDVSWIRLNYADITLDEYGYPEDENPYMIYGQWAVRGVGDLLPKNYQPE